jgi:hypothetical protein
MLTGVDRGEDVHRRFDRHPIGGWFWNVFELA